MRSPLYVNGKFLAQRTTGVQRVAREVLRELDGRPGLPAVLLCPPGAAGIDLKHIRVRAVGPAGLPLHVWEQAVLPWAARDGLLLSLAGSAPALARRQACVMHDAAVFDWPQAYRRSFVAWYRWLFRRLARRAEALFTVSEFARHRLEARLGATASPIEVVPNGSDHVDRLAEDDRVLQRLDVPRGGYLLALGSANPTKNLPALVRAHERSGLGARVGLVIAGGENSRVFAAGASSMLPPGVQHAGPVSDAELKALYRHALAFVFPSLYEGFGLPPLEAMRCGCPVIASREAALPEVCGDAALYVDPTDESQLAAALSFIAADEPFRRELARAGRERAARFTWAASADCYARRLAPLLGEEAVR